MDRFSNIKRLGRTPLTFGKYKGECFIWVYSLDKNYCEWAINQINPSIELFEFQLFIIQMLRINGFKIDLKKSIG